MMGMSGDAIGAVLPRYFLVCQGGLLDRFGQVRLMFVSNAGDAGAQATAGEEAVNAPPASLPLPLGCLASDALGPSANETSSPS